MNRLKKVMLVVTLASVLTVGFAMFGCSSDSTPATPAQDTNVGSLAPDFQFYDSEERLVSLSDLRGKPVVLNFWATWCGPCVYEMPYLQQVYEEWSDRGLVLLAINMGGTSSQVEEFLQSHDLSLPVLLDTKRDVAARYSIRYIPTTFFIDKEGTIQAVKVGAFPNKEAIEGDLNKIVP
ncbi:MAG: redoxin domain-containing protein [Dehalococcoidia bacterium]|nr:MAG: redoxin domain-containing protein [Dehalococcoidia bacterium]